jgi:excisionase family DNA binding protein
MPEPLWTVRDLAAFLGCGRDLAYALVSAGSIASIHLAPGGRAIRIRPEAVADWLRSQENGTVTASTAATVPHHRRAMHARRPSIAV